MSAQLLKLPRRLELEHYVTMALRKVDQVLARLEEADGDRDRSPPPRSG